jgi:hypothetical protein
MDSTGSMRFYFDKAKALVNANLFKDYLEI